MFYTLRLFILFSISTMRLCATEGERIAIIGAGPAGLISAHYLLERGHKNITIFEASNEIGGKCHSCVVDGRSYDMGAIELAGDYDTLMPLVKAYGMNTFPPASHRPPRQLHLHTQQYSTASMLGALIKYTYLSLRNPVPKDSFLGISNNPVLTLSTQALIDRYNLQALEELLTIAFPLYGYGRLDQIPVAHTFRFLTPKLLGLLALNRIPLLNRLTPDPLLFITEGFQGLCQRIAARLEREGITIHRNTPVGNIIPHHDYVDINVGNLQQRFGRVIMAAPLSNVSMPYLTDVQRDALSHLRTQSYGTTVFRTNQSLGHGVFINPHYTATQPTIVASKFNPDETGDNIYNAYAYGLPERDGPELDRNLRSFITENFDDTAVTEIIERRHVNYYTKPSISDIRNGIYETLNRINTDRLKLTGCSLTFETVECVAAHAKSVVNTFEDLRPHKPTLSQRVSQWLRGYTQKH